MQQAKKIGKRVLQIGLPLVILGIVFYYVKRDWGELTSYKFQWNPGWLALAFPGFLFQELSYGLIWRFVLARLGSKPCPMCVSGLRHATPSTRRS